MVHELIYTLISVIIVSLISLIGVITLIFKKDFLKKFLFILVALAAGAFLGAAFLDLIPELLEQGFDTTRIFLIVIAGFILFFIIEKFIHWHHCKTDDCEQHHSFTYMSLVGDGFHNFVDGAIIAAAYLADIRVGIITTIVIAIHEIPQEIGDFGVLIHGGFSVKKALTFNFLTASLAIIGGIAGFLFLSAFESIQLYLVAIAAGGFLYVGAADLIPELHKETNIKKALPQILFIIIGVVLIFILNNLLPHI
jgi:zinc and cadmium transporter